jgi:hypothetical protein
MVASPDEQRMSAVDVAAAMCSWMGDAMQTELVPAKCAARLGQCFSTTQDAAHVGATEHVSHAPACRALCVTAQGRIPCPSKANTPCQLSSLFTLHTLESSNDCISGLASIAGNDF